MATGLRRPRPRRRPWLWAVIGVAAVVAISVGVVYYWYSLCYESTDDAFLDGHIIPVSAPAAAMWRRSM